MTVPASAASERPVHRTRTPAPRETGVNRNQEPIDPLSATPAENLLRALLGASGRRDALARVAEGSRALIGGEWAVVLQLEGGAWLCRSASGSGPKVGEVWEERIEWGENGRCAQRPAAAGGSTLILPLDGQQIPTLVAVRIGPGSTPPRDACAALEEVASDLDVALRRGVEIDTLREQAFLDSLTECYNRRGFDEHLAVEILRAQRYDRMVALMLVDLDCFKLINDGLGHQAGDHVLRGFCSLLMKTYRSTDIVSRFGGDEFAVVFPETNAQEAGQLAVRVRDGLPALFPDEVVPAAITASFGIASFPDDAGGAEDLIAAADRALYLAKAAGRDRIVIANRNTIVG